MNRLTVKRSADWDAPGPWWRPVENTDKSKSATIKCPDCGVVASLDRHQISADGMVNPSVLCPTESCTWHVFVKLDGW